MNRFIFTSVILIATFSAAVYTANAQKPTLKKEILKPRMVRVAVARDARELSLAVSGSFTLRDESTGKVLKRDVRLPKAKVRLLDKGILIGLEVYPFKKIIIDPAKDASITLNNKKFRGMIILVRTKENRLTAINSINIEDYVKGVLYHEVSHHWPMEALKAQAVATRTYALFSMKDSSQKDYDMTNDIYSQVYGGQQSERYRTGLAVDRTEGEVLSFKDKILPAYFHATCAGNTESVSEMWGMKEIAPLKGVPCSFCQDSPHMAWKKNFRLKDIQDKLIRKGYKIGLIKEIVIVDRNRSERVNQLKVSDREGREVTLLGKDFREIIGPNILRSNNYEIIMKGYYVDFLGKGWGHGVGMCQWGARGMSAQQFTYKQILSYYYPSSVLLDYHDLASKPTAK